MNASGWHFAFSGNRILLAGGDAPRLPTVEELSAALAVEPGALAGARVPLRPLRGRPCTAYDLPGDMEPPPGTTLAGLRLLATLVPADVFQAAGAALQKVEWLRTHGFCSRCGHATERHGVHEAMVCPRCGHLHFPRLSPAVIVLIERGREMLLARSPGFPPGVYSTVAGFVEPGESLEETVHREILEEVGVKVTDLRYFGSQPWPFPHSLMVGFVARWLEGEIVIDDDEIEDARWFTPEEMPPALPFQASIARRLVDDFLARVGGAR
ncbi:MAG TPA: NAD(+) diphosphatase [Longimicrobiales bacterium]|nr:NAD(+) diphosphatase [Longimicrobiales bacterium]